METQGKHLKLDTAEIEENKKRFIESIVGVYLKEHGFSVKKFGEYCQVVYVAKKKGVNDYARWR